MRLKKHFSILSTLCLTACGLPAVAGALFPCVKAVSSRSGNFIVSVDVQFEPEPRSGRPHRISLNVLPKENFINAKDKLVAPATYWTNSVLWSVVLDSSHMHNEPQCPLPLITDDGEFLILLQTGPTFSGDTEVLQVYRRRDHPGDLLKDGPDHGIFIKDIALTDLWPPERVAANFGWDDETPQWFAGGTFEFSGSTTTDSQKPLGQHHPYKPGGRVLKLGNSGVY